MALDNKNLRRYLLGASTGAESDELSVRIIEDELFADQMSIAESDLIEAYLENELGGDEREQFENTFLSSNERREHVEELALLKQYATRSSGAAQVVSADTKDRRPFLERFSIGFRPIAAAFGIILIGLLVFAGWRLFLSEPSSALEQQYAVLNQADFGDLSKYRKYSTVELISGVYRDSGSDSKVSITGTSESVLFRLSLTFTPDGANRLTAQLTRDGKPVFDAREVRAIRSDNVTEARFLIPRSVLNKGQYQLNLTQPGTSNAPVVYSFAIE